MLSSMLRTRVDVQSPEIKPLSYGAFLDSLTTPSGFHLLKAEGLEDCLMLDIEPVLLSSMIDRLLGGGRADEPPHRQTLGEIELLLAGRVVRALLEPLEVAWKTICRLNVDIVQAETNPRLLRALPSDETVVSLDFAVTMDATRGLTRLAIPWRAVQRAEDKLNNAGLAQQPMSAQSDPQQHFPKLQEALADVEVTLAETTISAAELQSLRVGDILVTETAATSPAIVSINGEARYLADPGACQGRKAVCLEKKRPN